MILHLKNTLAIYVSFIQDDFNPRDTNFNTMHTMSKRIVDAMLPGLEGKVYKASLHEGMNIFHIYVIYCILHIFCILVFTAFCIRTGWWSAGGFLLDWSPHECWTHSCQVQICRKTLPSVFWARRVMGKAWCLCLRSCEWGPDFLGSISYRQKRGCSITYCILLR